MIWLFLILAFFIGVTIGVTLALIVYYSSYRNWKRYEKALEEHKQAVDDFDKTYNDYMKTLSKIKSKLK